MHSSRPFTKTSISERSPNFFLHPLFLARESLGSLYYNLEIKVIAGVEANLETQAAPISCGGPDLGFFIFLKS
jgi:hypothetical protein